MNRLLPRLALASAVLLAVAPAAWSKGPKRPPDPDLRDVAAQLLGRALTSDEAWTKLVELCDDIGHRLSGSPQLEAAVVWATARMAGDGLEARTEEVQVPVWVRGVERLTVLGEIPQELDLLALGGSIGTPDGGLEGEVVVVDSFDHLDAVADTVKGRIVVFDVPFTDYGDTVAYRGNGANAASKHGAIAVLVRSITPVSLDTPHTGAMRPYAEDVTPIPAAAITVEAASRFRRLQERGRPARVRLELGATRLEDRTSHNVVGDVHGRELPDEVVILGCHLDSWDVGQGAQDDGAGCVAAMEAGRLIAALPVRPRRTVRVVLFTNEENGLAGGKAFAEAHADEPIVAALEMDTGSGQPFGWRVDVRRPDADHATALQQQVITALAPLATLLAPVGATRLEPSFSGADIGPLVERGHLGLGLDQDTTGYWPIHHTEADTLDKIDRELLKRNVAVLAVTAWWLAESPTTPLPR